LYPLRPNLGVAEVFTDESRERPYEHTAWGGSLPNPGVPRGGNFPGEEYALHSAPQLKHNIQVDGRNVHR